MVFTKLGSLVLMAVLLGLSAAASGASSVRVRSEVCGSHAGFTTSGLPVLFQGKSHVLTSSWGVLEESVGNCHEVTDPTDGRVYSARLSVLEWSVGYALLEVPGLPAVLKLDDFSTETPSSADLEVHGPQLKRGRVVASRSTRHHLPGLSFTFEMVADRMPSTFAGAPVYGKTLDGILSAQWVDVIAGSYARIREWKSKGAETPNHFFVIPISQIRKSLAGGLPKRSTIQPAVAKLADRDVLLAGKHKWQILCPPGAGEPPKDGVGPIGGGDGVGVGGSMKGTETCTTRVTLQTEVTLDIPAFYPAAFSKELDQSLSPGEALLIPFLNTRNIGGNLTRVPYFSLGHFFNELWKGKRSWSLVPEKAPILSGSTDLERLKIENRIFKQLLLDSYPLISDREDDRDDYRFLYTHAIIIDSLNWNLLRLADWNSLITTTSPANFAQGVMWQGQPLRTVLASILKRLDDLYFKAGGML